MILVTCCRPHRNSAYIHTHTHKLHTPTHMHPHIHIHIHIHIHTHIYTPVSHSIQEKKILAERTIINFNKNHITSVSKSL